MINKCALNSVKEIKTEQNKQIKRTKNPIKQESAKQTAKLMLALSGLAVISVGAVVACKKIPQGKAIDISGLTKKMGKIQPVEIKPQVQSEKAQEVIEQIIPQKPSPKVLYTGNPKIRKTLPIKPEIYQKNIEEDEFMEKLFSSFDKKYFNLDGLGVREGMTWDVEFHSMKNKIFRQSSESFMDNLLEEIRQMKEKGISDKKIQRKFHESLIALQANCQDSIEKVPTLYDEPELYQLDIFQIRCSMNDRKDIIGEFLKADSEKIDSKESYLDRASEIFNQIKEKRKTALEAHRMQIKSKITYAPQEVQQIGKLSEEDVAVLKNVLVNKDKKYETYTDSKALVTSWMRERVGGVFLSNEDLAVDQEKMLAQVYPKWSGVKFARQDIYDISPVYRWMCFGDKSVDEFVDKFTVGGTYEFPTMQSCSKYAYAAEISFRDSNPDMNLKFIIHPKSKVSKAYDIAEQKYGNSEVVYPKGSRFKVLDNRIEEYIHTIQERNSDTKAIDEIPSTLHRWIVELQEI